MDNNMKNNSENGNENENKEKKMAEVEKKSAFPILSVGITWLSFALIFRINSATKFFLVTVLSYVVYLIIKSKFPAKKIEIMMEPEKEKNPPKVEKKEPVKPTVQLSPEERELKDLNDRIYLELIEIKILNDSIDDEFVSKELSEIEGIMKKIHVQLNDESKSLESKSKKIEQLTQFFDYYMPTTRKILESYKRIEKQRLTGENAMETKKRVEESLPFVKKAFEKELDNMFSDEMLDITTDIDVLESVLSKEGLIEKNTISGMRDIEDDIKNDFFN